MFLEFSRGIIQLQESWAETLQGGSVEVSVQSFHAVYGPNQGRRAYGPGQILDRWILQLR